MNISGIGGSVYGMGLVDLVCCVENTLTVEAALLLLDYRVMFLLVVMLENGGGWITLCISGGAIAKEKVLT